MASAVSRQSQCARVRAIRAARQAKPVTLRLATRPTIASSHPQRPNQRVDHPHRSPLRPQKSPPRPFARCTQPCATSIAPSAAPSVTRATTSRPSTADAQCLLHPPLCPLSPRHNRLVPPPSLQQSHPPNSRPSSPPRRQLACPLVLPLRQQSPVAHSTVISVKLRASVVARQRKAIASMISAASRPWVNARL